MQNKKYMLNSYTILWYFSVLNQQIIENHPSVFGGFIK